MLSTYHMINSLTRKPLSLITVNKRQFWGWLNTVFNKPDPQRIEAVGPDKAAAEWLLRNGASVKWTGSQEWLKDYDLLPKEGMNKQLKIKEIDATDSSISHIGFPHLNGLTALQKMVIANNGYIEDQAIQMLGLCADSLKHLEIISCIGVTDKGIVSLTQLKNLDYLKLFDLPSVKDRDLCLKTLQSGLKCNIDWKEAKPKDLF